MDDIAIRAVVRRLARPHPSGGQVVEHAAILAAGANSSQILTWITDHSGRPEEHQLAASQGLHGNRLSNASTTTSHAPSRYVLPPGALDGSADEMIDPLEEHPGLA
jgi:hypothetical protein